VTLAARARVTPLPRPGHPFHAVPVLYRVCAHVSVYAHCP